MNRTEQKVEALLRMTVEGMGCEIWGVEFLSQGRHSKLRLYIDKADGVSIDDCEKVSRQVSDVLDVENMFTKGYTLEVSSPGMDRILFNAEQYESHVGETVDVRLNFPLEGKKRVVGLLAGIENAEAIVQADGEEYSGQE